MKKYYVYVLMYQGEVDGVFKTRESIEEFRKNNEISRDMFKEEFSIVKTILN